MFYVFTYMTYIILYLKKKFLWISLHECRSKRLGFTCFYVTLINVLKNDNMIGVFEQIFMKKQ